jgi:hypothetical protein
VFIFRSVCQFRFPFFTVRAITEADHTTTVRRITATDTDITARTGGTGITTAITVADSMVGGITGVGTTVTGTIDPGRAAGMADPA